MPRLRGKNKKRMGEVTVESLARFMGIAKPSTAKFAAAIEHSIAAAQAYRSRPLPEQLTREHQNGIQLLAARLLLAEQLDAPPAAKDVPLIVRYWWMLGDQSTEGGTHGDG